MRDPKHTGGSAAWSHPELAHAGNEEPTVAATNLRLLASLNHEIRTPLSGILGMTDLLLESGLTGEQEEYVSAARECAETLFDLLNATLEYSSLQADCVQLESSEFRAAELVDGVIEEAGSRARARGMELRYQRGSGLDQELVGDAHRVRQLILHVLNLAIRYGAGDWLEFNVSVEPHAGRATLGIDVTCAGAAFQQAGALSGSNLGMAVVQGLLRLLGGTMESGTATAKPGQSLTLRIPLDISSTQRSAAREPGRALRIPRILVVDDNRISQQVIGALLSKGGWQYHTASDGFAALEAAGQNSYQLVLMDLQMPGMGGLEATERLRQIPGYSDTPVLALTADVSDPVRAKCREAGMKAFLEKPIHTTELNAMLSQFLISPDGD